MDLEKALSILSVVGGVVLGVPVLLRALVLFLRLIPGEQPDRVVEKVLEISEKIADVVSKIYPKPKV